MSLLRPVALSRSQGQISQRFDGTFAWEPAGWLRTGAPCDRGRRSQFRGAAYCPHVHLAIDYICAEGTPVRAMKAGTIIGQGRNPYDGAWMVYVRLRNGTDYQVVSLSYHLQASSMRFAIGDTVKKGSVIARSGNTGWSTGPHLHQELIRARRGASISEIFNKGLKLDPQPFIAGKLTLRRIAP